MTIAIRLAKGALAVFTIASMMAPATGAFAATTAGAAATPPARPHHHHRWHGMAGPQLYKSLAPDLHVTFPQLMKDLRSGQTLNQIAQAQHVSTATLQTDIQTIVANRLQAAEKSGHLTAAQVTAREHAMDARIPSWINHPLKRRHAREGMKMSLALRPEVAKLLKITPKTLAADMKSGQSIAAVAQAHGVSSQTLTQELDAWAAQKVNARIAKFVNTARRANPRSSGASAAANTANG